MPRGMASRALSLTAPGSSTAPSPVPLSASQSDPVASQQTAPPSARPLPMVPALLTGPLPAALTARLTSRLLALLPAPLPTPLVVRLSSDLPPLLPAPLPAPLVVRLSSEIPPLLPTPVLAPLTARPLPSLPALLPAPLIAPLAARLSARLAAHQTARLAAHQTAWLPTQQPARLRAQQSGHLTAPRNLLPITNGDGSSQVVDGQVFHPPAPTLSQLFQPSVHSQYSRKVFVGGLPPGIHEDEIADNFVCFGPLSVYWPYKDRNHMHIPPRGYAFLLFQEEISVHKLIDACLRLDDKLYLNISSSRIPPKRVQVRPWRRTDAKYVLNTSVPVDHRKTVFVGGVPRHLKAGELVMKFENLFGQVVYAEINTDRVFKYPNGAVCITFSNKESYVAAIRAHFVRVQNNDKVKIMEIQPYVRNDQMCDVCQGQRCGGRIAPFFCPKTSCLKYYCKTCWFREHSIPGREFHKAVVKRGMPPRLTAVNVEDS